MRWTFGTMGTVASILTEGDVAPLLRARVETIFEGYDQIFSLYRRESPLAAIARGELHLADAPDVVRDEYARAVRWRARTHGWFDPHRPDGVLDLSGTIKAVAMARAAEALAGDEARGVVSVGGDLLAIGGWQGRAGVADPADRGRLLADVDLGRRAALATSGSAERGDHIWSRAGSTDVLQATVRGHDIVTADVVATALVAAGTTEMDDLLESFDVDALVVTDAGMFASPGWPRPRASADLSPTSARG